MIDGNQEHNIRISVPAGVTSVRADQKQIVIAGKFFRPFRTLLRDTVLFCSGCFLRSGETGNRKYHESSEHISCQPSDSFSRSILYLMLCTHIVSPSVIFVNSVTVIL